MCMLCVCVCARVHMHVCICVFCVSEKIVTLQHHIPEASEDLLPKVIKTSELSHSLPENILHNVMIDPSEAVQGASSRDQSCLCE